MSRTARILGVTFEEWPKDFEQAFVIEPKGLSLWLGGGDIRRDDTPRPTARGSFSAPGYLSAKTVPLKGAIIAPSPGVLARMSNQITSLLLDRETARMVVQDDDSGQMTWADVGLAQQGIVTDLGDGFNAEFQIQFWSPDPYRFGEENVFGPAASVTAYHRGSVEATPIIEVTGAASSYAVTSPGGTFQVSGITAGGTHVIDMNTGWVYRNGVLVQGVAVRAETWAIPPGARWAHTVSSGSLTVRVPDTYA